MKLKQAFLAAALVFLWLLGSANAQLFGDTRPAGLPITGGSVTGPVLFGTGTTWGGLYQLQSALSEDHSLAGYLSRPNMFFTTLNPSQTTINDFHNVFSMITVNGPGVANGEVSSIHGAILINLGATYNNGQSFESRMDNYGTISGGWVGSLILPNNWATGTAVSITGQKISLYNSNTTTASVGAFYGIDFEAMAGGGSLPTYYDAIRIADANLGIVTLGGINVGGLGNPTAGTIYVGSGSITVLGTTSDGSTYPFVVKNSSSTNMLLLNDAGTLQVGTGFSVNSSGLPTITGPDTSGSTAALLVRNSTPTTMFSILDNGDVMANSGSQLSALSATAGFFHFPFTNATSGAGGIPTGTPAVSNGPACVWNDVTFTLNCYSPSAAGWKHVTFSASAG